MSPVYPPTISYPPAINPCLGGDCGKSMSEFHPYGDGYAEDRYIERCDNCASQEALEEAIAEEPETRITDEEYAEVMDLFGDVEGRSEEIRQGWADDARDAILEEAMKEEPFEYDPDNYDTIGFTGNDYSEGDLCELGEGAGL